MLASVVALLISVPAAGQEALITFNCFTLLAFNLNGGQFFFTFF